MARNLFDDEDSPKDQTFQNSMSSDGGNGNSTSVDVPLSRKYIFVGIIAIILLLLIAGGRSLFFSSNTQNAVTKKECEQVEGVTAVDLCKAPEDQEFFSDTVYDSVVNLRCGDQMGSGWVIELTDDEQSFLDDDLPTEIVTTFELVKNCQLGYPITTSHWRANNETFDSYVYSYDMRNNLAILMTAEDLPSLPTHDLALIPFVRHWVGAFGVETYPDGDLYGWGADSARIKKVLTNEYVTNETLDPARIGAPFVNSAGQVLGITIEINNKMAAKKIGLICVQLNDCTRKQILK